MKELLFVLIIFVALGSLLFWNFSRRKQVIPKPAFETMTSSSLRAISFGSGDGTFDIDPVLDDIGAIPELSEAGLIHYFPSFFIWEISDVDQFSFDELELEGGVYLWDFRSQIFVGYPKRGKIGVVKVDTRSECEIAVKTAIEHLNK